MYPLDYVPPGLCTPPRTTYPQGLCTPQTTYSPEYVPPLVDGLCAGGTHPTGMHSCLKVKWFPGIGSVMMWNRRLRIGSDLNLRQDVCLTLSRLLIVKVLGRCKIVDEPDVPGHNEGISLPRPSLYPLPAGPRLKMCWPAIVAVCGRVPSTTCV